MKLNKTIMVVILVFLLNALQQTTGGQANGVQERIDLTGEWVGETSSGETGIRRVRIEHNGTEVLMTNLTDSKSYKKGEWLMKGSFSENPFRVIVNAFAVDNPNIKTTYDGSAEVVSNDLIKISLPPRQGRRRLVRGTTVLIQRVNCNSVNLQGNQLGQHSPHCLTIYLGGAGMDGAYISDQIEALNKECIGNAVAGRRTAGTIADARNVFKYRYRRNDEDWNLSSIGVNRNPSPNDRINLIGYSYGSLVAAQTALYNADRGIITENIVLVGSPISQELLGELQRSKNIRNVHIIDLKQSGDAIYAGMSDSELRGALVDLGFDTYDRENGAGHFYYAPDSIIGKQRRKELAKRIKEMFGDCR